MRRSVPRVLGGLLALLAATACSSATQTSSGGALTSGPTSQTLDPAVRPATDADVHFMSGMIPHHAQAVKMALWAPTHGASLAVRVMCERIVVAQRDEIALMQNWLRDRGKPVPEATATHLKMKMDGMEHDMLMPGMLSDQEMAQLDAARGPEFDRLFLTFMIRHHQGAVSMVDELLNSYGGAQDDLVYKVSSDVYADQTTEIDRMEKMLAAMAAGRELP